MGFEGQGPKPPKVTKGWEPGRALAKERQGLGHGVGVGAPRPRLRPRRSVACIIVCAELGGRSHSIAAGLACKKYGSLWRMD